MSGWRRLIQHHIDSEANFKKRVFFIIGLALLSAGVGVLEPLVLKYFIDEITHTNSSAPRVISFTVFALILLSLSREVINGMHNWLIWKARLLLQVSLQSAAVEKLYSLPITFHHKVGVGSIMTKFDRSINSFVSAFCEVAFFIVPTLAYLLASFIVMLRLEWRLSLLLIIFAPLPAAIGMWASKEQTVREKLLLDSWTKIYSRLYEAFSCILTVKSFAMERAEINNFLSNVADTNERVIKGIERDTKVGAYKSIVITIARVVAIAFGGYLIIENEITLGTLVAFLGYIGSLFGPVQGLTNVYQTYRKASVSTEVLNSILEREDPVADPPFASEIERPAGNIDFLKVSFEYSFNKPVFSDITLNIRAGETIALIGPSGSGKSTLMSLIMKLHLPTSGSILIDGRDIRTIKHTSIRQHIGIVLQDSLLFNDTIRNNIAYGAFHSSQEAIEDAARIANAHEFIMQLPQQYNTVVGEKGSNLSGGQKQRIAIARAVLKDPAILILDEPTSALDSEAEDIVIQAFKRLMKGRTTFIVSHKIATIVNADRIIALKDGKMSQVKMAHREQREEEYALI